MPCLEGVDYEIAIIVRDGIWQQRMDSTFEGINVYGYADVIKRNYIYDIKL
ncbi:hypothetical protein FACS1894200_12800 [Spirochaetia bacterium]|nr:hypothetical protein FACS1894200_12800 [Spirochaetia bacterium]